MKACHDLGNDRRVIQPYRATLHNKRTQSRKEMRSWEQGIRVQLSLVVGLMYSSIIKELSLIYSTTNTVNAILISSRCEELNAHYQQCIFLNWKFNKQIGCIQQQNYNYDQIHINCNNKLISTQTQSSGVEKIYSISTENCRRMPSTGLIPRLCTGM